VLDRPNPVNGSFVQGNMSQAEFASFTNYHPTPIRHGMTLGELAQMYNVERKIGARLRVIPMQGCCAATGSIPPGLSGLTRLLIYGL